jgi:hypothetical protein
VNSSEGQLPTPVGLRSGQRALLWSGVALYALSFLLYGVTEIPETAGASSSPLRGYLCAVYALFMPVMALFANFASPKLSGSELVGCVAALVGGLINPLFLITLVNVIRGRQQIVETLRIVLVVMILCCGIAFYALTMYPREGFLVWVLGMLLVVASADLAQVLRLP